MKPAKGRSTREVRDTILLVGACAIAVLLFGYFVPAVLFYPGQKLLPLQMRFRPHPKMTGAIVIAAIDDRTVEQLGGLLWTATEYAELISALGEYGAAVVGFAEPLRLRSAHRESAERRNTDFNEAPDETVLLAAVKRQGATLFASQFTNYDELDLEVGIVRREAVGKSPDPLTDARSLTAVGSLEDIDYGESSGPLTDARSLTAVGSISYRLLRRTAKRHLAAVILEGPGAGPGIWSARYRFGPSISLGRASLGTANSDILVGSFSRRAFGIPAEVFVDNGYYAPFAVALTAIYLRNPISLSLSGFWPDQVDVGTLRIPLNGDDIIYVNLRAPGAFAQFSVADIIARQVPRAALKTGTRKMARTIAVSHRRSRWRERLAT